MAIADLEKQKEQERLRQAREGTYEYDTKDLDERIKEIQAVTDLTGDKRDYEVRTQLIESISTTQSEHSAFLALALIEDGETTLQKQLIENITTQLQGKHDQHDDPVVREYMNLLASETLSDTLKQELNNSVHMGI